MKLIKLDEIGIKRFVNLYHEIEFSIPVFWNSSKWKSIPDVDMIFHLLKEEKYHQNENFQNFIRVKRFDDYFEYMCKNPSKVTKESTKGLMKIFHDSANGNSYIDVTSYEAYIQRWLDIEIYPGWHDIMKELLNSFESECDVKSTTFSSAKYEVALSSQLPLELIIYQLIILSWYAKKKR